MRDSSHASPLPETIDLSFPAGTKDGDRLWSVVLHASAASTIADATVLGPRFVP